MKSALLFLILFLSILSFPYRTKPFLFRKKSIHHLINDPFQVKPENVTKDNLFGWLNMKNHIKFKLWTRKNPKMAHEIKIGNLETLHTSNFDARRLTKILVHGYAHSVNEIYLEDWIIHLRDAYLHLADLNVMIIDYTVFALPMTYWTSGSELAAEQLSQFIKFIFQNGVSLEQVHLLGYSLGAHVAGRAGHKLSGKIGRITGLDPANPGFRLAEDEYRLDRSDALYVDIIHTNAGGAFMEGHLGLHTPLGHSDFYPNSGNAQPGCPLKWTYIYETLECDHGRSVRYFVESITSPTAFEACQCNSWASYVKGDCPCTPEDMTYMGEHSPHSTRGTFFLFTRGHKPYGLGRTLDISLPDIDEYEEYKDNYTTSTEYSSGIQRRNVINSDNKKLEIKKEVIPLISSLLTLSFGSKMNKNTTSVNNTKNVDSYKSKKRHVELIRKPFVIQLADNLLPKIKVHNTLSQ